MATKTRKVRTKKNDPARGRLSKQGNGGGSNFALALYSTSESIQRQEKITEPDPVQVPPENQNEQQKRSLCRFIGQAHLLPNMSLHKLKTILSEMNIDDWNLCDIPTLKILVNKIQEQSRGEL